MASRDGLQTPFDDAVAPTPSGAMSGGGTSGGWDLEGGQKESANMSGLPPLPTTVSIEGAPGVGAQIPWAPVDSPGTIPTKAG